MKFSDWCWFSGLIIGIPTFLLYYETGKHMDSFLIISSLLIVISLYYRIKNIYGGKEE